MKDLITEEAIKFLKNIVKQNGDLDSFTSVPFYKKEAKAIETILTELDTLQNGFNTAVEHQTKLIRENTNFRYQLFNNKKELEDKDKIINLMAESILNYDTQLVINYYRDKNEVIRRFMGDLREEMSQEQNKTTASVEQIKNQIRNLPPKVIRDILEELEECEDVKDE